MRAPGYASHQPYVGQTAGTPGCFEAQAWIERQLHPERIDEWRATLVQRVADASLAVYQEVLELDPE